MKIRDTTYEDVVEMIELIPDWIKDLPAYSGYVADPVYYRMVLDNLWGQGVLHGQTLLNDDDYIVGALLFTLAPPFFRTEPEAVKTLFFVESMYRGLNSYKVLLAARDQAKRLGATKFYIGSRSGHRPNTLYKLYIRAGFLPTTGEHCWTKE